MKIIDDTRVSKLQQNLVRIGDLINVEGPILSLFQDKYSKKLYLFDWVDTEGSFNRWLIYHIRAKVVNEFIKGGISYKDLFATVDNNEFYYTDINSAEEVINYIISKTSDIPSVYKASNEVYFSENDCKGLIKIKETVQSLLKAQNPIARKSRYVYHEVNTGIFKSIFFDVINQKNHYPFYYDNSILNTNKAVKVDNNPFLKNSKVRKNENQNNRIVEYQEMEI